MPRSSNPAYPRQAIPLFGAVLYNIFADSAHVADERFNFGISTEAALATDTACAININCGSYSWIRP